MAAQSVSWSPWDRLNYALKELGRSGAFGLPDCYCCWLMAPSQPCLLSAGLSSKMDVVIYPPSLFLFCFVFGQTLTLLTCQTLRPGKFLSSRNASLCRWNLVHSGRPLTHSYSDVLQKRLWRRDFVASPFSLAHTPPLLLCVCGTRNAT